MKSSKFDINRQSNGYFLFGDLREGLRSLFKQLESRKVPICLRLVDFENTPLNADLNTI